MLSMVEKGAGSKARLAGEQSNAGKQSQAGRQAKRQATGHNRQARLKASLCLQCNVPWRPNTNTRRDTRRDTAAMAPEHQGSREGTRQPWRRKCITL